MKRKWKWDVGSEATRKKCIDEVLARIYEQEGAEFGSVAAQEIIDIVAQNIAPDIYNLAIKDAKKLINERLADLDVDLDLLEHNS